MVEVDWSLVVVPDAFYVQSDREILVDIVFHSCSQYIGTGCPHTIAQRHDTCCRPTPAIIGITSIEIAVSAVIVVHAQLAVNVGFPVLVEPIAKDGVQAYITIAVASPEGVVEIATACYPQLAVLGERSQIGGVDVLRETALVWQVLPKVAKADRSSDTFSPRCST